MNCLEFRRRLLEDPQDPALAAHRASCDACRAAALGADAFEAQLSAALQVPVPVGLGARLAVAAEAAAARRHRRRALATGFGTALAAAAALLVFWLPPPLLAAAADHVRHEPALLAAADRPAVPDAELVERLAGVGLRAVGSLGTVTYAGACHVRDQDAAHIVIDDPAGPITLLIMPSEPVGSRSSFQDGALHGVLVPLGTGSMAIISDEPEKSRVAASRLASALAPT